MDPNSGERSFATRDEFTAWFTGYCRQNGWDPGGRKPFKGHYVERYTATPPKTPPPDETQASSSPETSSSPAASEQGLPGDETPAILQRKREHLAQNGGQLVRNYNQGSDRRLNDIDITQNGWCLGMATEWIGQNNKEETQQAMRVSARSERLAKQREARIAAADDRLRAANDALAATTSDKARLLAEFEKHDFGSPEYKRAETEYADVRMREKELQQSVIDAKSQQHLASMQSPFWRDALGEDSPAKFRFVMGFQGVAGQLGSQLRTGRSGTATGTQL